MIHVRNLTKRYGKVVALDNVSFDVEAGEIVGVLGPNGAGKSTALRILSTYLPASGGTVQIAGLDVFTDSLQVRSRIGYLPESTPLYDDMRVGEYLTYRGNLKGLFGRRLRKRLYEVLAVCGIEDARDSVIQHLSKGYRQRVGLADALIHDPPLLILDEPTIGLDPHQIREVREFIKGLGKRHTVLLSSHILSEVQMTCDRVLIIQGGRIVVSDRTANLLALMESGGRVVLEVQGPAEVIERQLAAVPGVKRVTREPGGDWLRFVCLCEGGMDVRPDVFALVTREGWALRELQAEKANLEDVFLQLTR
ncbi:MAG: ABC transporter ATP-binding protein [Lentisphaerae bacterium]|nr:ABC transporter ATP-binding protein [Lentisphaerota bacterium]